MAYGFPFGFYEHNVDGFLLVGIPPVVPLAYAAYGWIAWTLARAMVRHDPRRAVGSERFTTPIIGTFVLAGFDFTYDAIFSTVNGMYSYRSPGGFFGVPVSNYVGWLLTGWVILQLWALIENRFVTRVVDTERSHWVLPAVIWAVLILPVVGQALLASPMIVSVGGREFIVGDIYAASVIAGLFTLVLAAAVALARVLGSSHRPRSPMTSIDQTETAS